MTVTNVLTAILVIIGGFMTFLIMLQEGKGGGLASLGGTKAAGIEGVTNPIRRATAYMAILFFLLAVTLAVINRPESHPEFFDREAAEPEAAGPALNVGATIPAPAPTVNVNPVPVPAPAVNVNPTPVVPKPAEAVKPTEAPKTAEPVKPADAPKTAEPVKPESPTATQPVKPSEAPKTETTKPVEPAKPDAPKTPENK